MDEYDMDFALRIVAAWEYATELERAWLAIGLSDIAYDTWTQVATGYWRKEVQHSPGSLTFEVVCTDDLPGYQAQVRLMAGAIPQRAIAHYEWETLEEAQADCTELATEIFSEGPTDITIPLRYFDE